MALWFLDGDSSDLPIYPIRQTQGRGNVQIQLSKIEKMSRKHGNFLIIIHDGIRRSWCVPFSWFSSNILPFAKIRTRPGNPIQRYLTVDELTNGRHNFSFGEDCAGNPFHVNLKRFYNITKSRDDLTEVLNRIDPITTEFHQSETPYILTERELHAFGLTVERVRLGRPHQFLIKLHAAGFNWEVRGNDIILTTTHPSADTESTLRIYDALTRIGRAPTDHIIRMAEWRPYQNAIRDAAMNTYQSHCAMCDVDLRSCLRASHIRPVAVDRDNRANLENVMLLCTLHDALFDRFLITVRSDYTIGLNPELETNSEHVEDWVIGLDGKDIHLPRMFPPNREFLSWHAKRAGVVH